MNELRNCPFCGGHATLHDVQGAFFVRCDDCHAVTTMREDKKYVINHWDRRTNSGEKDLCPFCGSSNVFLGSYERNGKKLFYMGCCCGNTTRSYTTEAEAIAAWRHRV